MIKSNAIDVIFKSLWDPKVNLAQSVLQSLIPLCGGIFRAFCSFSGLLLNSPCHKLGVVFDPSVFR